MFDKSTCSLLVEDESRLRFGRLGFGHFYLFKVLLDSGQLAKDWMLLSLDAMESE